MLDIFKKEVINPLLRPPAKVATDMAISILDYKERTAAYLRNIKEEPPQTENDGTLAYILKICFGKIQ